MLSSSLPVPLSESESSITEQLLERKVWHKDEASGDIFSEQLSVLSHWRLVLLVSSNFIFLCLGALSGLLLALMI